MAAAATATHAHGRGVAVSERLAMDDLATSLARKREEPPRQPRWELWETPPSIPCPVQHMKGMEEDDRVGSRVSSNFGKVCSIFCEFAIARKFQNQTKIQTFIIRN